jgi:hypothetical protein
MWDMFYPSIKDMVRPALKRHAVAVGVTVMGSAARVPANVAG